MSAVIESGLHWLPTDLRKAVVEPDTAGIEQVWSAMSQDQRVRALELGLAFASPSLMQFISSQLKVRPQTIRSDPRGAALKLERARSANRFAKFLLHVYQGEEQKALLDLFLGRLAAESKQADTSDGNVAGDDSAAVLDRAIMALFARFDPVDVVLFLLIHRALHAELRESIDTWLRELPSRSVEEMTSEGKALLAQEDASGSGDDTEESPVDKQEMSEEVVVPPMTDSPAPDAPDVHSPPDGPELLLMRCEELADEFRELADRIEPIADRLRSGQLDGALELVQNIKEASQSLEQLRRDIVHSTDLAGAEVVDSVLELRDLLEEHVQAMKRDRVSERLARVVAVLGPVLRLVAEDEQVNRSLAACRAAAGELLETIRAGSSDDVRKTVEELLAGRHPFALLARKVADPTSLDVTEDVGLDEWLRQQFGPIVAIAVLGRRLRIAPEPSPSAGEEDESPPDKRTDGPSAPPLPEADAPEESPVAGDAEEMSPDPANADAIEAAPDPAQADGEEPEEPGPAVELQESGYPAGELSETREPPAPEMQEPSAPSGAAGDATVPVTETAGSSAQYVGVERAPRPSFSAHEELICQVLEQGQLSLAYHLARVVDSDAIPAPVLRPLVLASSIRSAHGEIARELWTTYAAIDVDALGTDDDRQRSLHLILAASALRPGLLAPSSGGAAMLRALKPVGALYEFVHRVAHFGEQLNGVDPSVLSDAWSIARWNTRMRDVQGEVKDFLEHAPTRTVKYQLASEVWRAWLRPGGLIHDLLHPVLADDASQIGALDERLRTLDVDRAVQMTARDISRTHRGKIQYGALDQLKKYVGEAEQLVRRWIALHAERPRSDDFLQRTIKDLRQEMDDRLPAVNAQVAELRQHEDRLVRGAAATFQAALENFRRLFSGEANLQAPETSPAFLLNLALLQTGLPFGDGWVLEAEPSAELEELAAIATGSPPPWESVIEARTTRGDLEGARRVLGYLEAVDTDTAADLWPAWTRRAGDVLDALDHDVQRTRRDLEQAVVNGLLSEGQRAHHDSVLVEIGRNGERARRFVEGGDEPLDPSALRIDGMHQRLADIRSSLAEVRQERVGALRNQLDEAGLEPSDAVRIEAVLERGDVLTAEEYIGLAQRGQLPPEEAASRDEFREFFPDTARAIGEYLDEVANPTRVVRDVREGKKVAGMVLGQVPGAQLKQAADMLDAWFEMKRAKHLRREPVERLLRGLGFRIRDISGGETAQAAAVQVTADPVSDRNEIPAALYGSAAEGSYHVRGMWDRPSEEELLNPFKDSISRPATIVLYFGRMTEQRRRDLARLSKKLRRTVVVLDEVLLLFLCGERGARLPVLFRCALPFAHLEPYTTTASLVPPEMFFGRRHEQSEIVDPQGSSFLYGGRQLGKTALLRHVERTYHDPAHGSIVRWLDLKAAGIGSSFRAEEIWPLIARVLSPFGVLPRSVTQPDRLIQDISKWLDQDTTRRLLLLLDEADNFLSDDAARQDHHFPVTSRLKNLMDATGRRFKVVFAGLHNVLRTTRLANHPLGHLGDPIEIGPLFRNGQVRAARALVEEPFALAGYRFESVDLVSRILAQTNYYPSLIQLYGYHLMKHLASQGQSYFDAENCPPYIIEQKHVEDVYRGRELPDAVRERFSLTLQLDPRYELIAYMLAFLIVEGQLEMERGASVHDLRRSALEWWSAGFRNTSLEEFRVLLDEMVGLGVLRHAANAGYTLRNANVLLLMGTDADIEAVLLRERQPPPEYKPESFREPMRDRAGRRSPLTVQQVSALGSAKGGIAIVIGAEANDLSGVQPYLEQSSTLASRVLAVPASILSSADFGRWWDDQNGSREAAGTVVFVDADLPWSASWIDAVRQRLTRARSRGPWLRALFAADPATTLRMLDDSMARLEGDGVVVTHLAPWSDAFLVEWLDANAVPSHATVLDRIRSVTGNRPAFLYRYLEKKAVYGTWEQPLRELEAEQVQAEERTKWLSMLGLPNPSAPEYRTLLTLAEYGEPIAAGDLRDLLGDDGLTAASGRTLRWAEMLFLASQVDADVWQVDPLAARLLTGR
jgi:hypothetical protein